MASLFPSHHSDGCASGFPELPNVSSRKLLDQARLPGLIPESPGDLGPWPHADSHLDNMALFRVCMTNTCIWGPRG